MGVNSSDNISDGIPSSSLITPLYIVNGIDEWPSSGNVTSIENNVFPGITNSSAPQSGAMYTNAMFAILIADNFPVNESNLTILSETTTRNINDAPLFRDIISSTSSDKSEIYEININNTRVEFNRTQDVNVKATQLTTVPGLDGLLVNRSVESALSHQPTSRGVGLGGLPTSTVESKLNVVHTIHIPTTSRNTALYVDIVHNTIENGDEIHDKVTSSGNSAAPEDNTIITMDITDTIYKTEHIDIKEENAVVKVRLVNTDGPTNVTEVRNKTDVTSHVIGENIITTNGNINGKGEGVVSNTTITTIENHEISEDNGKHS